MNEQQISTAKDAYTYFTVNYQQALPESFEIIKEVGTRRIVRAWLLDEEITLSPAEEAKFMEKLDKKLDFFARKNLFTSFPLLLNLRGFLIGNFNRRKEKEGRRKEKKKRKREEILGGCVSGTCETGGNGKNTCSKR
jgi:hypothetical protein